jgi:uncharacterized pyridoxamine 5'-phosphate oxidase family protein
VAIEITSEMEELVNSALNDGYPCILGTASLNGDPNLSFKGSMMVFSSNELAFWERARKGGFAQLIANPKVAVLFRNATNRKAWRFYGDVVVHELGEIRESVMNKTVEAELSRDPERLGAAVVIKINKITTLGGEIIQKAE